VQSLGKSRGEGKQNIDKGRRIERSARKNRVLQERGGVPIDHKTTQVRKSSRGISYSRSGKKRKTRGPPERGKGTEEEARHTTTAPKQAIERQRDN